MASKGGDSAKVQRMRTIIAAGLGIAALTVAAVGLFFVLRPVGEVDAGQHFATLPAAERARTGEVVVTEYFSYACVHCMNFDPQIEAWKDDLPKGVRFERVPVAFSAPWRNLAAAYYAAEDLEIRERNHTRLFEAIHRAQLPLQSTDALAQFFDGHGTEAATFRRAMSSPSVRRALASGQQRAQEDQIQAVPTVVVDGRYRIEGGQLSRRQVLEVADVLIARELAARQDGAG